MSATVESAAGERFAQANGLELCYEELGDPAGEPLVLIMGLATQMIHWDEGFCALLGERGYRAIRFDNRDVGRSTKIDSAGVTHSLTVNQRQRGGEWVALGTYHFSTAADAVVRFRNDAADGFVVADAVRFATSNRPPVIGEMGDFPASVKAGESLMVFAKNITDRDGKVASVSFYRESNGIAGLQTGDGGDAFLGTDTTLANNAYSVSFVVLGLAPATYTYYAQAADEEGAVGNPLSTTNVVAP